MNETENIKKTGLPSNLRPITHEYVWTVWSLPIKMAVTFIQSAIVENLTMHSN